MASNAPLDKIDMSLDDIIKLNRKNKAKVGSAAGKKNFKKPGEKKKVLGQKGGISPFNRNLNKKSNQARQTLRKYAQQNLKKQQQQRQQPNQQQRQQPIQQQRKKRQQRQQQVFKRGQQQGQNVKRVYTQQARKAVQNAIKIKARKKDQGTARNLLINAKRGIQTKHYVQQQNLANKRKPAPIGRVRRGSIIRGRGNSFGVMRSDIVQQHTRPKPQQQQQRQQQQQQQQQRKRKWGRTLTNDVPKTITVSFATDRVQTDVGVTLIRPERSPRPTAAEPVYKYKEYLEQRKKIEALQARGSSSMPGRGHPATRGPRGRGSGRRGRGGRKPPQQQFIQSDERQQPIMRQRFQFNASDFSRAATGVGLSDRFSQVAPQASRGGRNHRGGRQVFL